MIVAKVHAAGDDARKTAMFPELWRAKVVAMHGARMLISGLERQGDQSDPAAPLFAQEWTTEVMVAPPQELAETPHRPA